MRRNFQPTRRTAQQVKADEDFALRMQRQEREVAAHQVAYYQEMQRRQQSLEDMGGVPQQPTQVCHSQPSIFSLPLQSHGCICACHGWTTEGRVNRMAGMCCRKLLTDFVQHSK